MLKRKLNKVPQNKVQFSNELIKANDLNNKTKALYMYLKARAQFYYDEEITDLKYFTIALDDLAKILKQNSRMKRIRVREYLSTLVELELIDVEYLELNSRVRITVVSIDFSKDYTLVPVAILNNKYIPIECIPTYAVLASYEYKKQYFKPSIETLRKDTSQSRRVVQEQLKTLEEAGVIRVDRAYKTINRYTVLEPRELLELPYETRVKQTKKSTLEADLKEVPIQQEGTPKEEQLKEREERIKAHLRIRKNESPKEKALANN